MKLSKKQKKSNPLDAYKVVTKDNYEIIKEIFLEASIKQSSKEDIENLLIQKIGLNKGEAKALVDVEYTGTFLGKPSGKESL